MINELPHSKLHIFVVKIKNISFDGFDFDFDSDDLRLVRLVNRRDDITIRHLIKTP